MKVLHVCESLIGGPASYLEEILPQQVRQFGADNVVVLAPAAQRNSIAPSIGCVVETYQRKGRDVRSILALALAIRACIKRHNPDVVHLHSSFAGAIGRLIIRKSRSNVRVVYCAHCWAFDRPQQTVVTRLYAMLERRLSRRADAIVNISPHEVPLLRRAGIPLGNTRLVVSGIKDVAPGFEVEAWSVPDHIPEAIYRRAPGQSYIAATQWHPEFHHPDSPIIDSSVLLGDFLTACQRAKFQPAVGHSPFRIRDRAARLLLPYL